MASSGNSTAMTFQPFNAFNEMETVGTRWKQYLNKFTTYLLAIDLRNGKRKIALLLNFAGDEVYDDYLALLDANSTISETYSSAKSALTCLYNLLEKVAVIAATDTSLRQEKNESVDRYVERMQHVAKKSQITEEPAIFLIIATGCSSTMLQRFIVRWMASNSDNRMTTEHILDFGRSLKTQSQPKKMTPRFQDIGLNHPDKKRVEKQAGTSYSSNPTRFPTPICNYCGKTFPHPGGRKACPAVNHRCQNCWTVGHFEGKCIKSSTDSIGNPRLESSNIRPGQDMTKATISNDPSNSSILHVISQIHPVASTLYASYTTFKGLWDLYNKKSTK